jgi:hypothetical protein
MTARDLPAGQPDPNCAVQPAWPLRQLGQEWLAEQEALPAGCHRPESQFAVLISLMQDHAPGKGRALLAVPVEHSDELFA